MHIARTHLILGITGGLLAFTLYTEARGIGALREEVAALKLALDRHHEASSATPPSAPLAAQGACSDEIRTTLRHALREVREAAPVPAKTAPERADEPVDEASADALEAARDLIDGAMRAAAWTQDDADAIASLREQLAPRDVSELDALLARAVNTQKLSTLDPMLLP